jgi:tetratricopeptide (TPR) repeat protein
MACKDRMLGAGWAFSQRCVLYIRLSQLDKALPDCDRALALDARHQIARLNRGIIYATNSRYAEALAEFDAAVEINARNPVAHFNRGRILLSLFRDAEGNASLKKSCELGFAPACGALSAPR